MEKTTLDTTKGLTKSLCAPCGERLL